MDTTKNTTFVIGSAINLSSISKGSKGDFPNEHQAMKTQVTAQLTDGEVKTVINAGIYATAKYNVNTLVNTLKKTYYGSIEDGAGYVSVTKTSGEDADIAKIQDKGAKDALKGIKEHYSFIRKDEKGNNVKHLIFIVTLRPVTAK